jgi:carboxyl-terminal processing protease
MLALLLGSSACQGINLVDEPRLPEVSLLASPTFVHPTSPASATSASSSPTTAPPTPTPTQQSTPTPVPTATPVPTTTPIPTATPIPTPSAMQRQVFQKLWQVIKDEYLYRDFNGLDWDAAYEEYSQMIETGMTDENFYMAMVEMVDSLGDDHSVFLDPSETLAGEAEYEGQYDYAGIGLVNVVVPERNRLVVILVFPNGPADKAGIKIHDSILAIDGEPVLDEEGFRNQSLRGPIGSHITLTIAAPGEEPHDVTLTRERITSSLPVPYELMETAGGKRIGYIMLASFSDRTIVRQVESALNELTSSGPLDGLIIDNRQNSGGADTIVRGVLANFTRGTVGYFVNRSGKRAFNIIGQNINGSQDVPLVVLVGRDTVSFGEIFAGILQDTGRAHIIGQTTDGNVETLYIYNFADGSSAWIAHDTFQALRDTSRNWEESGIVPDQIVLSNWDEVTLESDPVIQAALVHFDQ